MNAGVGRWVLRGALVALAACLAPTARAAELSWSSPEDCASAAQFVEQVERQVGTSLASVQGIDFEIALSREAANRWLLTLVSIEQPTGERRVRALTGESCSEVIEAGAVALAMAIGAKEQQGAAPEPESEPEALSEKTAELQKPARRRIRSLPRAPAASVENPAPVAVFASAGAVGDFGALPDPGFGVEVDVGVTWPSLRVLALGSVFAPDETGNPNGRGGEFQLWIAGALACLQRPAGRFWVLACAGYEIGSLSAEGTGVTDPRSESSLWQALRADLGVMLPLGSGISGVVRAGALAPLSRREFVLDSSDVVHRPNSLTGRALAGLNVDF